MSNDVNTKLLASSILTLLEKRVSLFVLLKVQLQVFAESLYAFNEMQLRPLFHSWPQQLGEHRADPSRTEIEKTTDPVPARQNHEKWVGIQP